MLQRRSGFTMIELVFVIVVLGILAAIAVPRFAATREDAFIARGAATVSAVRSGIVGFRQRSILAGINTWPTNADIGNDFGGVLTFPVTMGTNAGQWTFLGVNSYVYNTGINNVIFTYNQLTGDFDCFDGTDICNRLASR